MLWIAGSWKKDELLQLSVKIESHRHDWNAISRAGKLSLFVHRYWKDCCCICCSVISDVTALSNVTPPVLHMSTSSIGSKCASSRVA